MHLIHPMELEIELMIIDNHRFNVKMTHQSNKSSEETFLLIVKVHVNLFNYLFLLQYLCVC